MKSGFFKEVGKSGEKMNNFETVARSPKSWKPLCRFAELFVGVVLLFSAIEHVRNQPMFFLSILRYQLVSPAIAEVLSYILPALNATLGFLLVLKEFSSRCFFLSTVAFASFSLAQATAFFRGLEIDCGCFGSFARNEISGFTIGRDLGLTIFCAVFWRLSRFDLRREGKTCGRQ